MTTIDPRRDAAARRIEALLAKAASTTYPDEADACIAKAQELMARHAIDAATLRGGASGPADEVVRTEVAVGRPYASARAALLHTVARNNHCRTVTLGPADARGQRCILIGHASDVGHVEALFEVLSLHATRALFAADPGARPKSFRHGFLLAYASRIDERLRAANQAARRDAERESGASVDLVLLERWARVDELVRRELPNLTSVRRTATSAAGFAGGRAAADRAPLATGSFGGPRALPGRAR